MINIPFLNHINNMKEKKNILIIIFVLFIISIINLYNAKYLNNYYSDYYIKQIIWYIVSFFIMFLITKNKNLIFKYSKLIYIINIILLIYVLLFGKIINGTKAWINFYFFSFQPSEFMKISLLLYLISIICNKDKKYIKIIKLITFTLIPSLLVFLEPDTGAIIFYFIIFITCLTFLKIDKKYYLFLFIVIILFISIFIYIYNYNQDLIVNIFGSNIYYRIDRFVNFKSNNYQLDLSLLSIFSSSIFRNGFNNILIYIPEGATDFIFAFIIGNFGLIMIPLILLCYLYFYYNLINILKYSNNKKTNYIIISFVYMSLFQVLINISMNIGLIPIIGITLPFLSYGGSSILIYFIFLGLIFNNHKALVHNKNMNNFHMDDMD